MRILPDFGGEAALEAKIAWVDAPEEFMSGPKAPNLPKGAPSLAEILVRTQDMPWRAKSLKGLHEKMLCSKDEESFIAILAASLRASPSA